MQSDQAYRLPVSNIAYHVYNRKEEHDRVQAISKRAFQRTMDTYHEHEHLADLFQVELDKQESIRKEHKEHEKLVKMKKKSSKRSNQSRSQDRSHSQPQHYASLPSQQPERHSLRQQLKGSGTSGMNGTEDIKIESASPSGTNKGDGEQQSLKRMRRLSDVSSSEVSGYGDDDVAQVGSILKAPHPQAVAPVAMSHVSRSISRSRSNERSVSSSPALPITPSPRLTPSEVTQRNVDRSGNGSGMESENRSSIQPDAFGSVSSQALSSSQAISFAPNLAKLGGAVPGRRKRKQAIPVHPSVVERIPGITIKFQREREGDQLQVEILKNPEDYNTFPDSSQATSDIQAQQDIQKVEQAIKSGRQQINISSRLSDWNRSLSSSLVSLSWSTSNGGSSDSLATMQDLIDARSLPLSWENFSTRECVVNKVIGKHGKDLDVLKEVVQETIASNQYSTREQDEEQPRRRDRNHDASPGASATPPRRLSDASTGASAAAAAAASTGNRSSKASGTSAPIIVRPQPTRTTRSRTHVSGNDGQRRDRGVALVAPHDDIEQILKQKRRKKLEERRQEGSKASSKDGSDDEERDQAEAEAEAEAETEAKADHHAARDIRKEISEEDEADDDDDVRMANSNNQQQPRKLPLTTKDAVNRDSRKPSRTAPTQNKASSGAVRKRRPRHSKPEVVSSSSSSSEVDDSEADEDYHGGDMKSTHSKRKLPELKRRPSERRISAPAVTPPKPMKIRRKSEPDTRLLQPHTAFIAPRAPMLEASVIRRTKKVWRRGKNSRKEDEVGTTTDASSDNDDFPEREEEGNGDKEMPLVNSVQSSRSMPLSVATTKNPSSLSISLSEKARRPSSLASTPPPTPPLVSSSVVNSLDTAGRTRGRGRSFSSGSTMQTGDKNSFFESALDAMNQKRRDALAKKRAAKAQAEEREQREKADRERLEEVRAQKVESSNMPKSSKSLPGRVLRRTKAEGSAEDGTVDPDCTSCRMELTIIDKAAWKTAQEGGEIVLPKTWSTRAILCTTCRLHYLDHHSRCTACFYVPVKEEMATSGSSCSRCKAGTWLMEKARVSAGDAGDNKRDGRRRTISDASLH
ncbi:hypothetical protein BGX28_004100 [Mortierella sp. GBA30]|nr:hypothetical protein BGX28_004100 [Mortierella sp. GBA30]